MQSLASDPLGTFKPPSGRTDPDLLLPARSGGRIDPRLIARNGSSGWLSTSSAQYRIQFATQLVKEADLSPISSLAPNARIDGLADWLGVVEWSSRTKMALTGAVKDPARLALLALCSPEYVVSA